MLGKSIGNNKGQLLIEAMVAMGVISVGLLGVFSLLANSLGISKLTSNQYVGTYLAAEGIEVTKNMIDTNVFNGDPWNKNLVQGSLPYSFTVQYNSVAPEAYPTDTHLMFNPANGTYNYQTGSVTTFSRTVTVTAITLSNGKADELQVDSIVNWTDQGGTKDSVDLEDDFYNWR